MISLKIEEAEVPINETTLAELQESLNEMKRRGMKKCRVSSPFSKTVFILSVEEKEEPLLYNLRNFDQEEHA